MEDEETINSALEIMQDLVELLPLANIESDISNGENRKELKKKTNRG